MPELTTQIGILYRVIGQLQAASDSGRQDASYLHMEGKTTVFDCARPPQTWRNVSVRWLCSFYCLWFSLPLSIWLSSGWFGLLLYWQTLSGAACLVERFSRGQRLALAAIGARNAEAACAADPRVLRQVP
ncbi:MAG: hypothetical protein WBE72_13210 [Terracidiphilus sp.]